MKENIENRYTNKSGRVIYHGYQKWSPHNNNNKIAYRYNMKNSRMIGYTELHYMYQTIYHII